MSLPLADPQGRIHVAVGGTPVSWNAGLGYTALGQLCVTSTLAGTDTYQNGMRISATGLLVVAAQSGSLVFNAGLPFNAADGSMARQTDVVPGADDPYVAGIRVGPTGGVYFTTAAP